MSIHPLIRQPLNPAKHLPHPLRHPMLLPIQHQLILPIASPKFNRSNGTNILRIECNPQGVINGQNVLLVVLAPVLDPGYVGGGSVAGG